MAQARAGCAKVHCIPPRRRIVKCSTQAKVKVRARVDRMSVPHVGILNRLFGCKKKESECNRDPNERSVDDSCESVTRNPG